MSLITHFFIVLLHHYSVTSLQSNIIYHVLNLMKAGALARVLELSRTGVSLGLTKIPFVIPDLIGNPASKIAT
jgi:hypothetical protein